MENLSWKERPALLTNHQISFSNSTSCFQERLPETRLLFALAEVGSKGPTFRGVGGDVCFPCCSCSFPGGPQLEGGLGKQILGNLQGSSGASFSAITKQQREHCFQKLQAKRNRARVAGTVSQSELFHTPSAAF